MFDHCPCIEQVNCVGRFGEPLVQLLPQATGLLVAAVSDQAGCCSESADLRADGDCKHWLASRDLNVCRVPGEPKLIAYSYDLEQEMQPRIQSTFLAQIL